MKKKQYISPCIYIDVMEAMYILAGSSPEKQSILFGGDDDENEEGTGIAESNSTKLFDDSFD